MEMLLKALGSLVPAIPILLALIALLALAVSRWNRHPRVSMLSSTAAVMMIFLELTVRALAVILPFKMHESGQSAAELGTIFAIVGGISGVLRAIALVLVTLAIFSERGSIPPPERSFSQGR